jgi:hypothetical protein
VVYTIQRLKLVLLNSWDSLSFVQGLMAAAATEVGCGMAVGMTTAGAKRRGRECAVVVCRYTPVEDVALVMARAREVCWKGGGVGGGEINSSLSI